MLVTTIISNTLACYKKCTVNKNSKFNYNTNPRFLDS